VVSAEISSMAKSEPLQDEERDHKACDQGAPNCGRLCIPGAHRRLSNPDAACGQRERTVLWWRLSGTERASAAFTPSVGRDYAAAHLIASGAAPRICGTQPRAPLTRTYSLMPSASLLTVMRSRQAGKPPAPSPPSASSPLHGSRGRQAIFSIKNARTLLR
jgi:hypothetical protein